VSHGRIATPKLAVTSLLRHHSPSEAKKGKKKQHPNHLSGRLGLVTFNVCCLLAASRERRDYVRSANLYGSSTSGPVGLPIMTCVTPVVEQRLDLLVAGIWSPRYNEGVDHVIVH